MTCKKTLTNQISLDILPIIFVEVIVFTRFPFSKITKLCPSGYNRANSYTKRLTGTPEVKGYSFDLFLFVRAQINE
jgi:hypothetical protein